MYTHTAALVLPHACVHVQCAIGSVALGLTHRGFCEYYTALAAMGLPDKVAELAQQYADYNVVTTGHSLGGAAATLCAVDLAVRFGIERERLMLYSFGAPRPGDAGFAAVLTKTVGSAFR
jgi:predicted lipase